MKNSIIGLLAVIILVLVSMQYKGARQPIYRNFPRDNKEVKNSDALLSLYVFFTKNNCRDCMEIIEVLNRLPAQYSVIGVVPQAELEEEPLLRKTTGATFPLISVDNYKKYIPPYAPSILGVSGKGDIYFLLPAVPNEKKHLEEFLNTFYLKAFSSLVNEGE